MKTIIILIILWLAIAAGPMAEISGPQSRTPAPVAFASTASDPEPAPIVERKMDYHDFTLTSREGAAFNLREYATGKRLTIVGYIAAWCNNSIENGHVIKRLYDKYKDRGLGLVIVTEYSAPEEIAIYANRIGIDCPVVTETDDKDARKKSPHYKYRRKVGDERKWGTPFYVIIAPEDILPAAKRAPLARHIHTVSGEIIEEEAEQFIEKHLTVKAEKE
ncbi:MAG: redoxin domain-containing protein [Blastocatellia bacterium]|nr:redoxin domain-containing protein [Blastocatellia bacterium]